MSATPEITIAGLQAEIVTLRAERDSAVAERAGLAEKLSIRDSGYAERMAHQAATLDVLKAMSDSPENPTPVFEQIVQRAATLCDADSVLVLELVDGVVYLRAIKGFVPAIVEIVKSQMFPRLLSTDSALPASPTLQDGTAHYIPDSELDPRVCERMRWARVRSAVSLPLTCDSRVVGALVAYWRLPNAWSDSQIALLETFAEQAVIAIAGAKAYRRQHETFEQQKATAHVLSTINANLGNLKPVFNTILVKSHELCAATMGALATFDQDLFRFVAFHGFSEDYQDLLKGGLQPEDAPSLLSLANGERCVRVDDIRDPDNVQRYIVNSTEKGRAVYNYLLDRTDVRSALFVPLRNNNRSFGFISAFRTTLQPFSDRDLELLESFAMQAIVAIDNARLLHDTREALEQQTATAELLQTINAAAGDLVPVFEAMLEKAIQLSRAACGGLFTYDGNNFHTVATSGVTPALAEFRARHPPTAAAGQRPGLLLETRRTVMTLDVTETDAYRAGDMHDRAMFDLGGARTILNVPLLKDDAVVGFISVYRTEKRAFDDREIALLENFAAQAVIAMENARLLSETREALAQQTAVAEVLRVINDSPGNITPVFDVILEKAIALCSPAIGSLSIVEDNVNRVVSQCSLPQAYLDVLRYGWQSTPGGHSERLLKGEGFVHSPDIATEHDLLARSANLRDLRDLAGVRTALWIGLRKDDKLLGMFALFRNQPMPFTDAQIKLAQSFAAQAVIAMENARLLGELRESLKQQTAIAEVLSVINGSLGDPTPVFETILSKAHSLFGAKTGSLGIFDGKFFTKVARKGYPPYADDFLSRPYPPAAHHQPLLRGETIHVPDVTKHAWLPEVDVEGITRWTSATGLRTWLEVPMWKDGRLVGSLSIWRTEPRAFTPREIQLLENFAAQALIAIDNARLLNEIRERQGELDVTFQSMGDGVALFDESHRLAAWNQNFQDILEVPAAIVSARPSFVDYVQYLAERGEYGPEPGDTVERLRANVGQSASLERTRPNGRTIQIRINPTPAGGFVVIYTDITDRKQAEDALRNARDAAEEALERQTSTANILKVIASSPADSKPAFEAIAASANRLLGGFSTAVWRFDGDAAFLEAFTPVNPEADAALRAMSPLSTGQHEALTKVRSGDVAEIPDTEDSPGDIRIVARMRGFRAALFVPLVTRGTALGFVSVTRPEPGTFSADDVELLKTFADQAVIAIQNAQLFNDLRDSLEQLKATQANLVQSEKMASLGQLTAGIAHEIKNPLNFVNNFASLSVELLNELKEASAPGYAYLGVDARAAVADLTSMLTNNLEKIEEHGKRANNIVRSMLEHSRGTGGEQRAIDLNALAEEALSLAYHGARAQDQSFNIGLERDFASSIAPITLAPQEVTRVLLNLISNGFYAARKRERAEAGHAPVLRVSTRELGNAVEIAVRDNGTGIAPELRDKLFQPFFTTKPTGEGTGLGLSITWDIVTKQHGGTIEVASEPGQYTEFTVRLPRARGDVSAKGEGRRA